MKRNKALSNSVSLFILAGIIVIALMWALSIFG
jgi:hypothetical protein